MAVASMRPRIAKSGIFWTFFADRRDAASIVRDRLVLALMMSVALARRFSEAPAATAAGRRGSRWWLPWHLRESALLFLPTPVGHLQRGRFHPGVRAAGSTPFDFNHSSNVGICCPFIQRGRRRKVDLVRESAPIGKTLFPCSSADREK